MKKQMLKERKKKGQKFYKMPRTSNNLGITLIALIITIVVLLILAVVAIRAVQGDGIIQHAKNAASKYTEAQAKEQILLGIQAYRLAHNGDFDVYDFVSNVKRYVVDNAEGSGTVVTLDGYEFNINADGTITANDVYGGILNGGTIEEYATANGYEGLGLQFVDADENGNYSTGWIRDAYEYGNGLVYTGNSTKVIVPTTIDGINVTNINWGDIAYGKNTVENIIISEGFNNVDWYFYDSTSLKKVILPNSTTVIGVVRDLEGNYDSVANMFSNCTNLNTIRLGKNLKTIGSGVFLGCTSLTNIDIPESVTEIGEAAFYNCTALKNIIVSGNIGKSAFYNCTSLENVKINSGTQIIGEMAFDYCENLKKIIIPTTVKTIEGLAISKCTTLETLVIPNSVTKIGNEMIEGNINLQNLYIESTNLSDVGSLERFYSDENNTKNMTIYVRNKEIADYLADKIDSRTTISTDYTWTAPAQ